jgi:hypothetical protein
MSVSMQRCRFTHMTRLKPVWRYNHTPPCYGLTPFLLFSTEKNLVLLKRCPDVEDVTHTNLGMPRRQKRRHSYLPEGMLRRRRRHSYQPGVKPQEKCAQ